MTPRDTEGNFQELDTQESSVTDTENVLEEDDARSQISNHSEEENSGTPDNASESSNQQHRSSSSAPIDLETIPGRSSMSSRFVHSQGVQAQVPSASSSTPSTRASKRKGKEILEKSVESQLLQIETKKLALLEQPEDDDFMFLSHCFHISKKNGSHTKVTHEKQFHDIVFEELTTPGQSWRGPAVPPPNTNRYIVHSPASSTNTVYSQSSHTSIPAVDTPNYSYNPSETSLASFQNLTNNANPLPSPQQTQYTEESNEASLQTFFSQYK